MSIDRGNTQKDLQWFPTLQSILRRSAFHKKEATSSILTQTLLMFQARHKRVTVLPRHHIASLQTIIVQSDIQLQTSLCNLVGLFITLLQASVSLRINKFDLSYNAH
mmetsp:Transcript_26357/g.36414  ORF Transcript_26357/g.36414 Transcript_26357/m.36414 type:complete len:107 (-) Transcript_26357:191-511(-)